MRSWRRKRRHIHVDFAASAEATAARKRAEADWVPVLAERRKHDGAAVYALRVREANHFAQKFRHALEGR